MASLWHSGIEHPTYDLVGVGSNPTDRTFHNVDSVEQKHSVTY